MDDDNITLDDIIFENYNEKEKNYNLIFDNISNEQFLDENIFKEISKNKKVSLKGMFEWTQLNEKWKNKIISDKFYTYECIDKNFCNIENALINSGLLKQKSLKQKFKNYLKDVPFDEFSRIINNYKFYYETKKEYIGNLNFNNIKTRNMFIKEIMKNDFVLQSDDVTLYIISKLLNIDFIVFTENTLEINTIQDDNLNDKFIIIYKELYEEDPKKYNVKLMGILENDEFKNVFERNKIPEELNNILDRHSFLLLHAKKALDDFRSNNKKITIRGIMKEIRSNTKTIIDDKELNNLMILLHNLINQEIFKNSINKSK